MRRNNGNKKVSSMETPLKCAAWRKAHKKNIKYKYTFIQMVMIDIRDICKGDIISILYVRFLCLGILIPMPPMSSSFSSKTGRLQNRQHVCCAKLRIFALPKCAKCLSMGYMCCECKMEIIIIGIIIRSPRFVEATWPKKKNNNKTRKEKEFINSYIHLSCYIREYSHSWIAQLSIRFSYHWVWFILFHFFLSSSFVHCVLKIFSGYCCWWRLSPLSFSHSSVHRTRFSCFSIFVYVCARGMRQKKMCAFLYIICMPCVYRFFFLVFIYNFFYFSTHRAHALLQ